MKRYYAKKKAKQNRNKVIRLMSTITIFVIVLATAFVICSKPTTIKASENAGSVKCYKSVKVEQGDTLWSIANEYMNPEEYIDTNEYIDELVSINSLISDDLTAGEHLIVAYFAD